MSFAERLARAAGSELGELRRLPGGHSGITWVATLDGTQVVVKSTPEGRPAKGRHDVLRQARVMRALAGVVPVPEIRFEDAGSPPFFGMSFVCGEGDEPILDETGIDHDLHDIARAWDAAVEVLDALGRADPAFAAGEPVLTPSEEVERWRATARAAGDEAYAAAAALADTLARTAPALERPAVVHGDFRIGNMLRRDGRIAALIDWEIWSLGDPRVDAGWLTLFVEPQTFPGLGRPVAGTPTRDALARMLDVPDLDWFGALACFKLAAIQSHNLRRHREGRREDPYLERFQLSVTRLLERGAGLVA